MHESWWVAPTDAEFTQRFRQELPRLIREGHGMLLITMRPDDLPMFVPVRRKPSKAFGPSVYGSKGIYRLRNHMSVGPDALPLLNLESLGL